MSKKVNFGVIGAGGVNYSTLNSLAANNSNGSVDIGSATYSVATDGTVNIDSGMMIGQASVDGELFMSSDTFLDPEAQPDPDDQIALGGLQSLAQCAGFESPAVPTDNMAYRHPPSFHLSYLERYDFARFVG